MNLLSKIFNRTPEIIVEHQPETDIDSFYKLANSYDRRILAMKEQMGIIPLEPNPKAFFPQTIEETMYYQKILNDFEEIKNSLPDETGILIISEKMKSKPYKSEVFDDTILLAKNVNIASQVKNFLDPNWYLDDVTIIKDTSENIFKSINITEKKELAWFTSQKQYTASDDAQYKEIRVRPEGTKERMIQMYSLLRVEHINKSGVSPRFVSDEEFQETLMKQKQMYQNSHEIPRDQSCYSLGERDRPIFEKDDAYYEGKNICILYDILDALNGF